VWDNPQGRPTWMFSRYGIRGRYFSPCSYSPFIGRYRNGEHASLSGRRFSVPNLIEANPLRCQIALSAKRNPQHSGSQTSSSCARSASVSTGASFQLDKTPGGRFSHLSTQVVGPAWGGVERGAPKRSRDKCRLDFVVSFSIETQGLPA